MKNTILLSVIILFGQFCSIVDGKETRLLFSINGFSIAPLEGTSETESYQAMFMALPASDGFAANVNIQIQPFYNTIEEYIAVTNQQFGMAGVNVLKEEISGNSVIWEYTGVLQEIKIHWYQKAELSQEKIYLVTATAKESQWRTLSEKLKTCVDSFMVEKNKQNALNDTIPRGLAINRK